MKRKGSVFLFLVFLASAEVAWALPTGHLLDGVAPAEDGRINILAVFAHQDDESIYGGGAVLSAMKDPRAHLFILCMTFDQTSDAIQALHITPDQSGRIRVQELRTAAAVYGADEVIQFNYPSRSLPKQDPEKLIEEIRAVIDRVGAQAVITHDPAGITGHWDHVACSSLATAAFQRSNARVLYYPTLPPALYRIALAFKTYDTHGIPAVPDFKVNIRDVKRLKRLACYAHASQMRFTSVGLTTDLFLLSDYEYFARVGKK